MQEPFRIAFLKYFNLLPSRNAIKCSDNSVLLEKDNLQINEGIIFEESGYVLNLTKEEHIQKLATYFNEETARKRATDYVLVDLNTKDRANFGHFIVGLRLIKEGRVVFSDLITNKAYGIMPEYAYMLGSEYLLYLDEIDELKNIINNLFRCNETLRYRTSLRYFDKSYENDFDPHDTLIDLMISSEALFLEGINFRDKGLSVGLACSMLIGENDIEREIIKEKFRIAYRVRNHIVHGKDFKAVKDEKFQEYVKNIFDNNIEIRDYLRRAIKKLICS